MGLRVEMLHWKFLCSFEALWPSVLPVDEWASLVGPIHVDAQQERQPLLAVFAAMMCFPL